MTSCGRSSDSCSCLQIPEDRWRAIKTQLIKTCTQSSRSSKPAIYGAAATEEVKKLRPLKRSIEVLSACTDMSGIYSTMYFEGLQVC